MIAYASMSGNTEEIADLLKKSLEPLEHEIDVMEMEHIDVNEILEYDGVLIGSYTWGDGDLPFETDQFYEGLLNLDLNGKKAAVFGSGDTSYPNFCAAVDLFQERLKACHAEIIQEGLKIEFTPDTQNELDRCANFAINFANQIG